MKIFSQITSITIISAFLLWNPQSIIAQENRNSSPWVSFNEMAEMNQNQPKKIMLFMEADWCSVCKRMKREVFPDSTIQALLREKFYPVRIDIESEEQIQFADEQVTKKELSKEFGIRGTPTIIFLNHDFSVIGNSVGFSGREEFITLLHFIGDDKYNHMSFDEFIQNHK